MKKERSSEALRISISGIRGIVGRSFTDHLVREFANAFALLVKRGKVLVAQDTRPTGIHFRRLIIKTLRDAGGPVVDIGIAPTPTVLFLVRALKAKGAIIVTASHNPSAWNGLKFVGKDGQFLSQKEINRLLDLRAPQKTPSSPHRRPGNLFRRSTALKEHLSQILRHLDVRRIRACRFRVAIDPCNGTGAIATAYFLKKLGCRVLAINDIPNGHFAHTPEPTAENLKQLSRYVCSKRAHVGFAQDPDADRLAIVTEKGQALSGEYTLALAVQFILSQQKTPVVVNLSTSRMIETIASRYGVKVYYSKIGERHVVEKMQTLKAKIGGEGNGGVIYPRINPARDSFVGMGLILETLARSQKPLSELIEALPRYEMIQKKLPLSKERSRAFLQALPRHFKGGKVNRLDGTRIDLKEGWVHARTSNTEPVLRLIAEAPSKETAQKLLSQAF